MTATAIYRFGLALALPLVLAGLFFVGRASADDAAPPERPTGLTVAAQPKTLAFTATWRASDGATHYKVRWRKRGAGFVPGPSFPSSLPP